MLALRRAEATNDLPTDQAQDVSPAATPATSLDDLFTADFLIDGPLLRAVRHDDEVPAVLLIDDVDRAGTGQHLVDQRSFFGAAENAPRGVLNVVQHCC